MQKKDASAGKIINAFIALLPERGYADITATDIATKAGVSRMAFYRHFSSKEEILQRYISGVGAQISQVLSRMAHSAGVKEYFIVLFRQLAGYSTLIRAVCAAHLGELILACLNTQLFASLSKAQPFDKYKQRLCAGAFYNVLVEWIHSGMGESAERMAGICCAMITE